MPKKRLVYVAVAAAAVLVLLIVLTLVVSTPTQRAIRLYGFRVRSAHLVTAKDGASELRLGLWSGQVKDGDATTLLAEMEKVADEGTPLRVVVSGGRAYEWTPDTDMIVRSDDGDPVSFSEMTRADLATLLVRPWPVVYRPWSERPSSEETSTTGTPIPTIAP